MPELIPRASDDLAALQSKLGYTFTHIELLKLALTHKSFSKTNNDPKDLDKDDHEVDAISGATITGDGVTDMIIERLTHYLPYLQTNENTVASNN